MLDWRKSEDYAYTESLLIHGWAWEFLRRNPDYIRAWQAYIAAQVAMAAAVTNRRAAVDARNSAWTEVTGRWGLVQPSDPSLNAEEVPILQWSTAGRIHVGFVQDWHCHHDHDRWPGYPSQVAISFDFRLPIEELIDTASHILRDCERQLTEDGILPGLLVGMPKGRIRLDKYPLYLRLLDAQLAGATVYRMGKVLGLKSSTTASRALKAAEAIAAGGYKDLLLRSPFYSSSTRK
jgi:hypothetical protein